MQTPVKPRTAYGEMLQYYLKMEPCCARTLHSVHSTLGCDFKGALFREPSETSDGWSTMTWQLGMPRKVHLPWSDLKPHQVHTQRGLLWHALKPALRLGAG
eukprot:1161590-Pelagomonas_calceolata.AAC.1